MLKYELANARDAIAQLQDTVAAFEHHHTDEISHKVALLIRNAELERLLAGNVQEHFQSQRTIDNLQRELSAASEHSHSQLDPQGVTMLMWQHEVQKLKAQLSEAAHEKERLQSLLDSANQQLSASQKHADALSEQLEDAEDEKARYQRLLDAADEQITALQASSNPEGGSNSESAPPSPAQPLARSMTLFQQTQQEVANLHMRLTAAQHAKASLFSELECARTERDLLLHDNAALTQRIGAVESELRSKVATAQHATAQAYQALTSLVAMQTTHGSGSNGGDSGFGSEGGSHGGGLGDGHGGSDGPCTPGFGGVVGDGDDAEIAIAADAISDGAAW
jgi:chromosome segregation ATPase